METGEEMRSWIIRGLGHAMNKAIDETCLNCGELETLCSCGNFKSLSSNTKQVKK